MNAQKKKAAAIAAVMRYLRDEEDAACAMAAMQPGVAADQPAAPQAAVNNWALSGRQSMMQLRTMMQMKSFHAF